MKFSSTLSFRARNKSITLATMARPLFGFAAHKQTDVAVCIEVQRLLVVAYLTHRRVHVYSIFRIAKVAILSFDRHRFLFSHRPSGVMNTCRPFHFPIFDTIHQTCRDVYPFIVFVAVHPLFEGLLTLALLSSVLLLLGRFRTVLFRWSLFSERSLNIPQLFLHLGRCPGRRYNGLMHPSIIRIMSPRIIFEFRLSRFRLTHESHEGPTEILSVRYQ